MALKKKKFPKAPKMTASKDTWDKYKKRCEAVSKHNGAVAAEKKQKEGVKAAVGKLKAKN